ncbi:hypothetical protein [Streptomyces sp. NPDC001833]|uniref:hypothetical protein n=1 Tax=Streptomyces sp. NPDC001833 TaxID=3154658 RepID=UPI0033167809
MAASLDKSQFVSAYARILTQAWSSDAFSRRLDADPRTVLAENGLETSPQAVVEIARPKDGNGPNLDAQISLWADGLRTGRFRLFVPYLPQMNITDLNDEDLGDLAGGTGNLCCSPCCCQVD